eukprot:6706348-Pyramimonas_sp.AAC.1
MSAILPAPHLGHPLGCREMSPQVGFQTSGLPGPPWFAAKRQTPQGLTIGIRQCGDGAGNWW